MTETGDPAAAAPDLRRQVRSAVIWRSGTQIFAQIVAWAATFLVIRILAPADYGLYAMSQVVLVLFTLFNGYGFANAAIQQRDGGQIVLRQLFGMLLLVNLALAAAQFLAAPLVAAYYRQPLLVDLLRIQALIYLTNPFQALGYAVLSREMDFRRQARVNVVSALIGAGTALGGALAGWGIWTLVFAPMAVSVSRGLGMMLAARAFMLPSFDFRGARALAGFGGMVMVSQLFWFVQTQADIVIAGRRFAPHELGFYTTSLFLAQIFVNKVVPPLNEVAFSAYSRIQDDPQALAAGFLKAVRIVMLVSLPFCFGLAAVAEPAIAVLLGEKWLPAAPILTVLALAMPFMTLHVLFAPATNAVGRPGLATRSAILGAVVMPLAFYAGATIDGARGIAWGWLAGYPLVALVSAMWAMPALGLGVARLLREVAPVLLAALAMLGLVALLDRMPAVHGLIPPARLAVLAMSGALTYGLCLAIGARDRLAELVELARRH